MVQLMIKVLIVVIMNWFSAVSFVSPLGFTEFFDGFVEEGRVGMEIVAVGAAGNGGLFGGSGGERWGCWEGWRGGCGDGFGWGRLRCRNVDHVGNVLVCWDVRMDG